MQRLTFWAASGRNSASFRWVTTTGVCAKQPVQCLQSTFQHNRRKLDLQSPSVPSEADADAEGDAGHAAVADEIAPDQAHARQIDTGRSDLVAANVELDP